RHVLHHVVGAGPGGDFGGHCLFEARERDLAELAWLGEIALQLAEGFLNTLTGELAIGLLHQPAMDNPIGVDHHPRSARGTLVVAAAEAAATTKATSPKTTATKATSAQATTELGTGQRSQAKERHQSGNKTKSWHGTQAHFGPLNAVGSSCSVKSRPQASRTRPGDESCGLRSKKGGAPP